MKKSKLGYKRYSPDVNNPYNIIPSGRITMRDVDFPVFGIDNLGNRQMMYPGREYQFPGNQVFELPMAQSGGESDPEMMFRNKYNTQLKPGEKRRFDRWAAKESKRQGRDILMDMGAYDVQGFWKSGDYKRMDQDNHGSDTWKKPNHPTFSNQSKYHGVDGWYGGNWTEDGGYQPSKQTLQMYNPGYYEWMFGTEPNRPEHLDMSRYESGINAPSPMYYQPGGEKTIELKKGGSLPKYQIEGEVIGNWRDVAPRPDISERRDATRVAPPVVVPQRVVDNPLHIDLANQPDAGTISQYVEESLPIKVLNSLAHPIEAASYITRGLPVPDGMGQQTNAMDMALDLVNPFAWANYGRKALNDLSEGNFIGAGFNALGAIPMAGYTDDILRMTNKVPKPVQKQFGLSIDELGTKGIVSKSKNIQKNVDLGIGKYDHTNLVQYDNGLQLHTYSKPGSKVDDVVLMYNPTTNENIAYMRQYNVGKPKPGQPLRYEPTNEWHIKADMPTANKDLVRFSNQELEKVIPIKPVKYEGKTISTDGLRYWNQQQAHGYSAIDDFNKPYVSAAGKDDLFSGLNYSNNNDAFESIRFATEEDAIKGAIRLEEFIKGQGLNYKVIRNSNNTLQLELPKLQRSYKSGGEMIKRADGSYSRRGLWDNIRANKGSGKKPTKEMLEQERKIRKAQPGIQQLEPLNVNSPEYRSAYFANQLYPLVDGVPQISLNEVDLRVDYDKYPFYDQLSEQQKEWFHGKGIMSRASQRAARVGPKTRNMAEEVHQAVDPIVASMMGLAGFGALAPIAVEPAIGGVANLGELTYGSNFMQGARAVFNKQLLNTPGLNLHNLLNAGFAADFITNRAPKIPGLVNEGEYGEAAFQTGIGLLDLAGARMLKFPKLPSFSSVANELKPSTIKANFNESYPDALNIRQIEREQALYNRLPYSFQYNQPEELKALREVFPEIHDRYRQILPEQERLRAAIEEIHPEAGWRLWQTQEVADRIGPTFDRYDRYEDYLKSNEKLKKIFDQGFDYANSTQRDRFLWAQNDKNLGEVNPNLLKYVFDKASKNRSYNIPSKLYEGISYSERQKKYDIFNRINPKANIASNFRLGNFTTEVNPITGEDQMILPLFNRNRLSEAVNPRGKIVSLKTGEVHDVDMQIPVGSGKKIALLSEEIFSFEKPTGFYRIVPSEIIESNTSYEGIKNAMTPETRKVIGENIDILESKVPGAKIMGSSKGAANANFPSVPGDYDAVIDIDSYIQHVKDLYPGIRQNQFGTAHELSVGDVKLDIDFNIIPKSKDGKAWGELASQLYRSLEPDQYFKQVVRTIEGKQEGLDIPYTPKELIDKTDFTIRTIADSFESSKLKHTNKPDVYISYGDIDKVDQAHKVYAKSILGSKVSFGPKYDASHFANIEKNKNTLRSINFAGDVEAVAADPKRMQVALEDYYVSNTTATRGVEKTLGKTSKADLDASLTVWDPSFKGGSASGAGLNNVALGDTGFGNINSHKQFNISYAEGISPDEMISKIKVHAENHTFDKATIDLINELNIKYNISQHDLTGQGYNIASEGYTSKDLLLELASEPNAPQFLQEFSSRTGIRNLTTGKTYTRNTGNYIGSFGEFNTETEPISYGLRSSTEGGLPAGKSWQQRISASGTRTSYTKQSGTLEAENMARAIMENPVLPNGPTKIRIRNGKENLRAVQEYLKNPEALEKAKARREQFAEDVISNRQDDVFAPWSEKLPVNTNTSDLRAELKMLDNELVDLENQMKGVSEQRRRELSKKYFAALRNREKLKEDYVRNPLLIGSGAGTSWITWKYFVKPNMEANAEYDKQVQSSLNKEKYGGSLPKAQLGLYTPFQMGFNAGMGVVNTVRDWFNSDEPAKPSAPVAPAKASVVPTPTFKKYDYSGLSRPQEIDQAIEEVLQFESPESRKAAENLLEATAYMENRYGADPLAYKRKYTNSFMSIDSLALDDLFTGRGYNGAFNSSQNRYFESMRAMGLPTERKAFKELLRQDDPRAAMMAARSRYILAPTALPSPNDKEAMFNYWLKYYNGNGVFKYKTRAEAFADFEKAYAQALSND